MSFFNSGYGVPSPPAPRHGRQQSRRHQRGVELPVVVRGMPPGHRSAAGEFIELRVLGASGEVPCGGSDLVELALGVPERRRNNNRKRRLMAVIRWAATRAKSSTPVGDWGATVGIAAPDSSVTPSCETGEEYPPNTRGRRPSDGHTSLHGDIDFPCCCVRSSRHGDKSKADPAPQPQFGGGATTHPVLSFGC